MNCQPVRMMRGVLQFRDFMTTVPAPQEIAAHSSRVVPRGDPPKPIKSSPINAIKPISPIARPTHRTSVRRSPRQMAASAVAQRGIVCATTAPRPASTDIKAKATHIWKPVILRHPASAIQRRSSGCTRIEWPRISRPILSRPTAPQVTQRTRKLQGGNSEMATLIEGKLTPQSSVRRPIIASATKGGRVKFSIGVWHTIGFTVQEMR